MIDPLVQIVDVVIAEVDGLYQDKMGLIANVETLQEACQRYLAHAGHPPALVAAIQSRLELLETTLHEEQRRSDWATGLIAQLRSDLRQCRTDLVEERARHIPARRRIRLRQLSPD